MATLINPEEEEKTTTQPQQEQQPSTEQQQPAHYTVLQQQSARHDEEQEKEYKDWRATYDNIVAEKASLYKADPKLAEVKRKEAALKTLVGAFGSLADTIAVANGGTAPLRDHRADIYQTQHQADAIDQNERARQADVYQKWLDRLERVAGKRPKWAKNDAALLYARMLGDDNRATLRMLFDAEKQKEQQKFTAEQNELNRKALAEQNADGKNNGSGKAPKESEIIRLPLSNGQELILPKGYWHSGSLEIWINEILKDGRFDENTRKKIRSALSDIGKMDNMQVQAAELGRLLNQYPEFEKVLTQYGKVATPNNGAATAPAASTDPQATNDTPEVDEMLY
jgi:hypothetical protein